MSMFWAVVILRFLFTATGVVAVLMQALHPVWDVGLVGGQTMHPRPWAWQQPDLSLVTVSSSAIDWGATLIPALGIAIGTYVWWRIGGRDLKRLKAAQFAAAADEPRAARR